MAIYLCSQRADCSGPFDWTKDTRHDRLETDPLRSNLVALPRKPARAVRARRPRVGRHRDRPFGDSGGRLGYGAPLTRSAPVREKAPASRGRFRFCQEAARNIDKGPTFPDSWTGAIRGVS